jgi:hypothetical protein
MPNTEALNRTRELNRSQTQLESKLEKRLSSYVMAASAVAAGVLTLSLSAEAKVVYTQVYVNVPENGEFKLDLNGDGITDFGLLNRTFLGHEGGQTFVPAVHGNAVLGYAGSQQQIVASALPGDVRIGSGGNFIHKAAAMATWFESSGQLNSRGPWKNAHNGFLGVEFLIDGEKHFGWARISVKGSKMLLTGYAYEATPNTPIRSGQTVGGEEVGRLNQEGDSVQNAVVRQPRMLGSLAQGVSGIVAWRREPEVLSARV